MISTRSRHYLGMGLIGLGLLVASWFVIDKRKSHIGLRVNTDRVAFSQQVPK